MNANQHLHGFVQRYAQPLPELKATLHRMTYEKNGADLVWLEREEENKTFAVAFCTIPQDDTGVFHILEHSVLCGSEKYPVKEPFVNLIKSSLETFLNAFTFSDKTMYPLCSRNDQDFLNLMDVYLDAVFHPLSVTDPHAFRQEGWHYELDSPQGELTYNGVVYNEMKGVYAGWDAVLQRQMNALLFPDNCYGFESGGYPEAIPSLTYSQYQASHKRFYHPSNARIFLDGKVDLDAVLAKLDSFLSAYDALEIDTSIPLQAPVHPKEATAVYEIGAQESDENKDILALGWVFGRFDEPEKVLAASALAQVLCGSNEAPLKKALLEQGLAEDVQLQVQDGIQQCFAQLIVRNTDVGKKEQILSIIRQVLEQQAQGGLDHSRIAAVLNKLEFSARALEYGRMPQGIVLSIKSLESWLYGGDPAQNLQCGEQFAALREKLDQGWFEEFLRSAFLENPHQAQLCLLPSKTLGEEKRQKEAAGLAGIKAGWSEEEIRQVMDDFHAFRTRQAQPDTPEGLATLPVLTLSDIPVEIPPSKQREERVAEQRVLHQCLETGGIVYLDLYFALKDFTLDQLSQASLLASLLGDLSTHRHSALELRNQMDRYLGFFSAAVTVFTHRGTGETTPYLVVSTAMLEKYQSEAAALVEEILTETRFDETQQLNFLLTQNRMMLEQQIQMSGNAYASQRAAAAFSPKGAVKEAVGGIRYLRYLQQQDQPETASPSEKLTQLFEKVFSRRRVTVGLTGKLNEHWLAGMLEQLPDTPVGSPVQYSVEPLAKEGFVIPAGIGFAAQVEKAELPSWGSAQVASQLLTYEYLWNTVRVQGGAYGVGLSIDSSGEARFSSYRDPNAKATLSRFREAGEALRQAAKEDLTNFIISTIGKSQPVLTPHAQGMSEAADTLSGITHRDRQQLHTEILTTTPQQLEELSRQLEEGAVQAGICVIGGAAVLEGCRDDLDSRENLL